MPAPIAGGPARHISRRLAMLDLALFRSVSAAHAPVLDVTLPALSHAADHGVLWWAVAGGLGASGGTRRRSAVRGLLALGIASTTANLPAKLSVRRRRPSLSDVPLVRQLRRQPTSSSFPSGHSASAAAFAVGVALESPRVGAAVGVVATAVALSRVYTGVHYPGDVVAGVALGAAAALVTTRTWPLRPSEPARARPASALAPALPDGEGLVVVVNATAGSRLRPGSADVAGAIRAALPRAEVVIPGEDEDLGDAMRRAVAGARVLGVAGGDGTVNCAAATALAAGLPLAVFPAGTLDHFARDLGVASVDETAEALRAGTAAAVDVASIQGPDDAAGQVFLNTASLGGYPELVVIRERLEEYLGKWPSMVLATVRVLRRGMPLDVEVDGEPRRVWVLFVGNCRYSPSGFAPTYRRRLDDGLLDVRVVDAYQPYARTRLVLALLSGRLGRSRVYEQRLAERLSVRLPGSDGPLPLARDGEVGEAPPSVVLAKHPRRLVAYRPQG